jgi:hypothetical protein
MVAAGVERVRVDVNWADAQPYASYATAPANLSSSPQWVNVGGVPTNFSAVDQVVSLAAARGLELLPVVLYSPQWAARHKDVPISPPSSPALYARFLGALVQRYGPRGSFWSANRGVRRVPIRSWQVWNEPDLPNFWVDRPWVPDYVKLLRAAHDAVKAADPTAKVVLAGTPDYSWEYLAGIYRIHGARSLFDVVAVHPYTKVPGHVIGFLQLVRNVMNANGDARKPMIATEVSFPSSKGRTVTYGFETDEHGQAVNTARTIRLLAAHRSTLRLAGFYYYTWIGLDTPEAGTFSYSGLLHFAGGKVVAKPVFATFRSTVLALEGCRTKGPVAGRCVR